MKIVKEGMKVQKTMQVTCKTCGAILEIEKKDVEKTMGGCFSPTLGFRKVPVGRFICPHCKNKNVRDYEDFRPIVGF